MTSFISLSSFHCCNLMIADGWLAIQLYENFYFLYALCITEGCATMERDYLTHNR